MKGRIETQKAFNKESLINNKWYRINIGCIYTEAMWANNLPFEKECFIRLNTADYQKGMEGRDIECWNGEIIGFSREGSVLINPKEYGLEFIYPRDPQYNSLLEQMTKTKEFRKLLEVKK